MIENEDIKESSPVIRISKLQNNIDEVIKEVDSNSHTEITEEE